MASEIEYLATTLYESEHLVIFTGAGLSTESGIPDFRSPDGLWSKLVPIEYSEFLASPDARRESWRRKLIMDQDMNAAVPNRGHRAVAKLVENLNAYVLTQNIDGLHQASGIADDRIIELHGNSTYANCLTCATRYELEPILTAFQCDETLPLCEQCGGIIKTATISFGQTMPMDKMRRAEQHALDCDVFLVIGSSLVVYPAAALPAIARQNGARLIILNRDPTEHDPQANLVLNREIGPTLGQALAVD